MAARGQPTSVSIMQQAGVAGTPRTSCQDLPTASSCQCMVAQLESYDIPASLVYAWGAWLATLHACHCFYLGWK